MRVSTAFNTMLAIPGARVAAVRFEPSGAVVRLRCRRRRPVCPSGWKGRAVYDRSLRRCRHLDLGGMRLFLEAEVRRLDCRSCRRIRTEAVPWARPAAAAQVVAQGELRRLNAVGFGSGKVLIADVNGSRYVRFEACGYRRCAGRVHLAVRPNRPSACEVHQSRRAQGH